MARTVLMLSPAAMWGLLAALPAVTAELLYKKWPDNLPWWYGLPLWIPLQLSIGYCIFRLVKVPNTSLLDAFVVWAFATTAMRVFVQLAVLQEPVKAGTWFALGLVVAAQIAKTFWGR